MNRESRKKKEGEEIQYSRTLLNAYSFSMRAIKRNIIALLLYSERKMTVFDDTVS